MARIEIARLRKDHGMSQSELAQQLQITQSFLSAIENGKSPLPPEKEARIMELFSMPDLSAYTADSQPAAAAKGLGDLSEAELIKQLLTRFHENAHSKDSEAHHHDHHERIEALEACNNSLLERNDALLDRNEKLATKNDELRDEIDRLRDEIYRLRSQLIGTNGNGLETAPIARNGEFRRNGEAYHHDGEPYHHDGVKIQ